MRGSENGTWKIFFTYSAPLIGGVVVGYGSGDDASSAMADAPPAVSLERSTTTIGCAC